MSQEDLAKDTFFSLTGNKQGKHLLIYPEHQPIMFLERQMLIRSAKDHILKYDDLGSNHWPEKSIYIFIYSLQASIQVIGQWQWGQITKNLLASVIPQCKILQHWEIDSFNYN